MEAKVAEAQAKAARAEACVRVFTRKAVHSGSRDLDTAERLSRKAQVLHACPENCLLSFRIGPR